jgi:hypothetical protein
MIDHQEASAALSEVDDITRRVRQSHIYQLAAFTMILWGMLVFAGNIITWWTPRYADRGWLAIYFFGIAGSAAASVVNRARYGAQTFDWRMLLAFLMFIAFGLFCANGLGHFGPRQLGAFWPIYFMLIYAIAGLWFGYAFIVIAISVTVLTLIGYHSIAAGFPLWMAFVNGGGLVLGGLWMRRS